LYEFRFFEDKDGLFFPPKEIRWRGRFRNRRSRDRRLDLPGFSLRRDFGRLEEYLLERTVSSSFSTGFSAGGAEAPGSLRRARDDGSRVLRAAWDSNGSDGQAPVDLDPRSCRAPGRFRQFLVGRRFSSVQKDGFELSGFGRGPLLEEKAAQRDARRRVIRDDLQSASERLNRAVELSELSILLREGDEQPGAGIAAVRSESF
jgi:hypothetical protein